MNDFTTRLLAAQRVEPTLRQRYETEMKAMFEQTLTKPRKISFMLSIAICAVMTVMLTIAALSTTTAPPAMRIGLGLGALYALGWIVMSARVLRRGTFQPRRDGRAMSAWPWVFMVTLVMVILIATGRQKDSVKSVWMLLYALVFLVMASMFVIQYWIGEARMKVEERLLEVQLRVAELAEELKRRN
jgi:MFS family permease